MADFVQTMKDWRRMCKTIGGISCDGCKLHADGNDCVAVYEGEMDYAKLEKAVTDLAAEHPEPVYPTWAEWLKTFGVVEVTKNKDKNITVMMRPELLNPIPAGIAQKLGIEPKDG